jgi:glycosyltransferase involved in cell wall biosynthesis
MKPGNESLAPRIAIASSGLGNIQRGIEAWAFDIAQGLREFGVDATLFSGGSAPGAVALRHAPRTGVIAIRTAQALRHLGGWRFGLGSPYEVEQSSFAAALWLRIRRRFDILHVQDPLIARRLEYLHRAGLSRPRVIYGNGTGEPSSFMRGFRHVQFLTRGQQEASGLNDSAALRVHTIPNLVDMARFSPGSQAEARSRLGLPQAGRIVLCCSAIRRPHKRVDVLIEEFADFAATAPSDWRLVIAGGRERETDEIISLGRHLLGDRVHILQDLPRDRVRDLYRAADIFTLASLYEMFGIVLLEAMAVGLPVLCHDTASFREVVGPAGHYADLSKPGGLAGGLAALRNDDYRARLSAAARPHVEAHFSTRAVVPQLVGMYRATMAAEA